MGTQATPRIPVQGRTLGIAGPAHEGPRLAARLRRVHRRGSPRRPGVLEAPSSQSLRRPALGPRLDVRLWERPVILEARPDRSRCQTGRQLAAGAAPATHRTAHGTDEYGQSYPGSSRRHPRPRRTWLSARRPAAKYKNHLKFLIGDQTPVPSTTDRCVTVSSIPPLRDLRVGDAVAIGSAIWRGPRSNRRTESISLEAGSPLQSAMGGRLSRCRPDCTPRSGADSGQSVPTSESGWFLWRRRPGRRGPVRVR